MSTSAAEATKSGPRLNAKSMRIEPLRPTPGPMKPRAPYWCGTLPDCPLTSPSCNGVSFETVRYKTDASGVTTSERGVVHWLDEDTVRATLERLAAKVVRIVRDEKTGAVGSCWNLDVRNHGYVREDRDVPLGCYLYMVQLDPQALHVRPENPEPIVAREGYRV